LGLSICQSIIEKYKGVIKVVSEPGHGATFVVQLPLHTQAEAVV